MAQEDEAEVGVSPEITKEDLRRWKEEVVYILDRNRWEEIVDLVVKLQGDDVGFKTKPGPAFQWYPGQWMKDDMVLLMSHTARGLHFHLIQLAWGMLPPCSVPAQDLKLRGWCGHPADWPDLWEQIQTGWRERGERWWQIGLCRTYLLQIKVRIERMLAARALWEKKRNAPPKPRAVRGLSKSTTSPMQLHTKRDALQLQASASAAASASSSSSPDRRVSHPLRQIAAAAAEQGSGDEPPAAAAARRGLIWVADLEAAFREATGVSRVLTFLERETVIGWLTQGVPVEVLSSKIWEVASRQAAKNEPVRSFRYLLDPLGDAVQSWREGRVAQGYGDEDLEEWRKITLARLDTGWMAKGMVLGNGKQVGPLPGSMLSTARQRILKARSVAEIEAVAQVLARAANQQPGEETGSEGEAWLFSEDEGDG